ncbi:MAG: hypothetical protein THHGLFOP_001325, partial [Candidatus Fervidibacter sp.]
MKHFGLGLLLGVMLMGDANWQDWVWVTSRQGLVTVINPSHRSVVAQLDVGKN